MTATLVLWVAAGVIENLRWVRVADLGSLRDASIIYRPKLKIFVVAHDRGVLALSAISPHRPDLGERVLFCRSSDMFEAPHGEKFDLLGVYFAGPAPRGMDRVAVKVEDGQVFVNPDDTNLGPARGESNPHEPTGPFCPEDSQEGPPGFISDSD